MVVVEQAVVTVISFVVVVAVVPAAWLHLKLPIVALHMATHFFINAKNTISLDLLSHHAEPVSVAD